ncbi:MAG: DUF4339 domain-containing protein [Granulosicoccus sp.]|nr:DUF4339 domain-containing protein [Granulosicoccus sp.]
MTDEQQWYVQTGSRVQGPYSTTEVGRYLLLGRIRSSDRVSKDGELWEPVTQVPELIPEELLDLESETGWNQFVNSRSHIDERSSDTSVVIRERRERSADGSVDTIRDQWLHVSRHPPRRRPPHLLPVSLLGVTLVALLIVIYLNTAGPGA